MAADAVRATMNARRNPGGCSQVHRGKSAALQTLIVKGYEARSRVYD